MVDGDVPKTAVSVVPDVRAAAVSEQTGLSARELVAQSHGRTLCTPPIWTQTCDRPSGHRRPLRGVPGPQPRSGPTGHGPDRFELIITAAEPRTPRLAPPD